MNSITQIAPKLRKHEDGSICLEGTRKLPKNFKPCCEVFRSHTASCIFDVRYEWNENIKGWWIAIDSKAGGGGIEIKYCPHCGESLI